MCAVKKNLFLVLHIIISITKVARRGRDSTQLFQVSMCVCPESEIIFESWCATLQISWEGQKNVNGKAVGRLANSPVCSFSSFAA